MQDRLHRPDRGLKLVPTRADSAQVGQRRQHADGSVTAHPQIINIIKEDDGGAGIRTCRVEQERAHHHFRAAGFADDSRPEVVKLRAKPLQTLGDCAISQVRSSSDDDSGRLAFSMRINDMN